MDRQQFIKEVKGSQPALRRLLTALCSGNRAEADDIAQEAYLRAYLSLDSFRGQASFATWIRRIAVNEFISSRRRERASAPLTALETTPSESTADSAFRYQALYAALAELPRRERAAVTLFYLEGYASKEVAAIMDTEDGAVRKMLSRARGRLQTLLKPSHS